MSTVEPRATPPGGVELPPPPLRLVETLLDAAGDSLAAVVLYGSQLLRASPDRHSAWDLVVIVDRYGPFHRRMTAAGRMSGPVPLLNLLGHVLPPSVTAVTLDDGTVGKCAIVSLADFRKALAPRSPDHFLKGRMVQRVQLLWAREEPVAASVEGWIRLARRNVLDWTGPWLNEPFDARSVPRRMLQVSYGGELRPEAGDRADEVYEAQADWLTTAYAEVLEESASEGRIVPVDEDGAPVPPHVPPGTGTLRRYRFARPPGAFARLRVRLYFVESKIRATLRWGKHVVTFHDWLGYLLRKVERRTGEKIRLTRLERKIPLVFLWPRVVRFFLSGRHRRRSDDPDPSSRSRHDT